MKITVVLLAKNEAGGLPKTLHALRTLLPQAEIIVSDDGSTDQTPTLARAAGGGSSAPRIPWATARRSSAGPVPQPVRSSCSWMPTASMTPPTSRACWPGWSRDSTQHRFTKMSVLLFSAAVIVFLIGLISEQITSLT